MGIIIEPKPGTYALILSCCEQCPYSGRAPRTRQLQRGYYVYLGSALGPGGLRARIAHHQKLSPRPLWHIDYLRTRTQIHCIWFSYDTRRREHQWARVVQTMRGAKILSWGSEPQIAIVGKPSRMAILCAGCQS